ncbi:MAG TPA: glycosyltransferase family 2 protein [Pirellulaceae bacterium]|nr:glycosyltransferase family 2 protein [Pirellulaceae bacterium]
MPFVPALERPPAADVVSRAESKLAEIESLWDTMMRDEVPAAPFEMPKDLRVSVVIPVYNEKRTIFDVIARVKALPFETEIIVIDDCSTDGTRGWLETVRGAPGLKLIFKDQNEGKGAALRTGFAAATGHVVVVQDADLEYDPRDIENVIRPIVAGEADVSYGSRYFYRRSSDRSFCHRLVNRVLTAASNLFTGLRLTDMETCHKAFRTSVIRNLPLKQNRFGFEPEVTAKLARRKYRVTETPSSYKPRGYAEGKKIGIRDAVNAFYCIARYGLAD